MTLARLAVLSAAFLRYAEEDFEYLGTDSEINKVSDFGEGRIYIVNGNGE